VSAPIEIRFPVPWVWHNGKRVYAVWSMNDRLHWTKEAERIQLFRSYAKVAAREAGVRDLAPSLVQVVVPFRTASSRRDPMNWTTVHKAVVDGLTDAGCWPDDTAEWVTGLEPECVKGDEVVVRIWPR
jgi:crossover junction endodeoxyribonuclease RusA